MNAEKDLLRDRANGMVFARPLFFIPLLGLFALLHFNSIQNTRVLGVFYFLMGATGGLTLLYIVLIPRIQPLSTLVRVQLVGDLFFITLLAGVTGNVESPFSILYIANIVCAALFFPRRGGIVMATTAISMLSLITFTVEPSLASFGDPFSVLFVLPRKETTYRLLLHIVAFYSTGISSSRFFYKMHEKEIGFTRLRLLHEDILRNIPSGLVTTHPDGRITSFNPAASHIMGITPQEAIGALWWDIFQWKELRTYAQRLMSTGLPQRLEGSLIKKNGESCTIGATLSLMHNDPHDVIGMIGVFQDLTCIKQMEEEMHQKRRLAAIGEMAAGMAHEIRNPLAAISGSVQLLKSELVLRGEYQPLMEIAIKETHRLNNIITEFILYAKPLPPRRRWVDLGELLSESVELLKNTHAVKGVSIDCPPPFSPIPIFIDPDQIKQVFWNLAINALQAMPNGGKLTIRPNMGSKDAEGKDRVEISFCDTGTGILPEYRSKIFDPFFTTKSTGSGLGLPIVQRIIEQHQGTLDVENTSTGTTFRLRLPQGDIREIPEEPLAERGVSR